MPETLDAAHEERLLTKPRLRLSFTGAVDVTVVATELLHAPRRQDDEPTAIRAVVGHVARLLKNPVNFRNRDVADGLSATGAALLGAAIVAELSSQDDFDPSLSTVAHLVGEIERVLMRPDAVETSGFGE